MRIPNRYGLLKATAMEILPLCVRYNLRTAVKEVLCGRQAQLDPELAYRMRAVLIGSGDGACLPTAYAASRQLGNMLTTLLECSSPVSMLVYGTTKESPDVKVSRPLYHSALQTFVVAYCWSS